MKQIDDVYADLMADLKQQTGSNLVDAQTNGKTVGEGNVDEPVTEDNVPGSGTEPKKPSRTAGSVPDVSDPDDGGQKDKKSDDSDDVYSWDDFIDDSPAPVDDSATKSLDWSKLSVDLGLETPVKSFDDLRSALKQVVDENKALKERGVENLPAELKEAIEVARQGGDFYTYLGLVQEDYKSIPPEELFEEKVAELFYNEDGSFNETEFNEYIESIPLADRKFRGLQIRNELIRLQEEAKRAYKQRIDAQKFENLRKLEASLNNFSKVGNFEVTPKAKKQLYSDLASGKFYQELGISTDGNHNWDRLLEAYFKFKYFEPIQKFTAIEARKAKTRQDLDGLSNSTVKRPGSVGNPVQTKQQPSGADLYIHELLKQLAPAKTE